MANTYGYMSYNPSASSAGIPTVDRILDAGPHGSTNKKMKEDSTRSRVNKADSNRVFVKKIFRYLFMLAILSAAFGFGALVHAYAGGSASSNIYASTLSAADHTKRTEVRPGDTLWSIARANVTDRQDIRDYISEIRKLNGLKSTVLKEGQTLLLP